MQRKAGNGPEVELDFIEWQKRHKVPYCQLMLGCLHKYQKDFLKNDLRTLLKQIKTENAGSIL